MPKYHKKHRQPYPYAAPSYNAYKAPPYQTYQPFNAAPYNAPSQIMGMPGMFAPFPFSMPTNVKQPAEPEPLREAEPVTKAERACMPFFEDELKRIRPRDPTDVVIIDFDRTLLGTPLVNPDFVGKDSRLLLEHGLGSGLCWPQSRKVLEAAIAHGQWDELLVDVAREASRTDSTVLVVTTSRQMSEIRLIEDALESQGIGRVDHFACTYSAEEDEEDGDDGEVEAAVLDGWAKQVMVELLLESYDTLERIVIFDSNRRDRTKFRRVVSQFVRDGWLNAEAFQIPDVFQKRTQLDSIQAQRQLIEDVVQSASVPLEKSIVVIEWTHKLSAAARIELLETLVRSLGESLLERVYLEDICIVKGSLPPDMRAFAAQRGQKWFWAVRGFKVENRILWLKLQGNSGLEYMKAAKLVRGVEDTETMFADPALPLTPPAAAPSPAVELPSLTDLGNLKLETFVYEHRELRLQKKRL